MADDWDVEDLLEAPFKKGTGKVSFWRSWGAEFYTVRT